jgi:poly-beta-1,6-N-acetyl-D-glucosamine synthase
LLTENFADPRVGLATAHPCYVNARETATAQNEGLYLRYETWLRKQESASGLLAMASGSLFAMRRSLWQPLDKNLGDDFDLPLRLARRGLRNVIDSRVAVSTRLDQNRPESMLGLKTRIISKDLRALIANRTLLNPLRHGAISVALWSHKLLRWFVPYFLLAMLASNFALIDSRIFRAFFIAQTCFYSLALAGFALRDRARHPLLSVPMSFCVVNFAAFLGTLKCFAGRTSGIWIPERHTAPASAVETEDLAR